MIFLVNFGDGRSIVVMLFSFWWKGIIGQDIFYEVARLGGWPEWVANTLTVAVAEVEKVKKLIGAIMLDLMWKDSIVHGRSWSSQSNQRCKTRRFFRRLMLSSTAQLYQYNHISHRGRQ